jgi:hypothetical protein
MTGLTINGTGQQPAGPQKCSWCGNEGNQVIFWHNFLHGGDAKGSGGTVFTLCDECFQQVVMTAGRNRGSAVNSGTGAIQYS